MDQPMARPSEPAAGDARNLSLAEKRRRAEAERRRAQEEALELGLENTFPASDPVAVVQPVRSVWDRRAP